MKKRAMLTEFHCAKRLAEKPDLFDFAKFLYEGIYNLAAFQRNEKQGVALTAEQGTTLYQQLFAHTKSGVFTPEKTHGSVGMASPDFFKQLPQKSNFYFNILFNSITNAIYQYRLKDDPNLLLEYAAREQLDYQRQPREPAKIHLPSLEELNIPQEELEGRFGDQKEGGAVITQGQHVYTLGEAAPYIQRAKNLEAPYLTGPSTNAYSLFKFLSMHLGLTIDSMKLLRQCLIAYTVSAHDHTLIEVLDAINAAVNDEDFQGYCKYYQCDWHELWVPLDTPEDYRNAFNNIFSEVFNAKQTSIQCNIEYILSSEHFPSWVTDIVGFYCDSQSPDYTVCLEDLRKRLSEIKDCAPELLQALFSEDQTENTMTPLDLLINLYCASRFSNLPFKLLITTEHKSLPHFAQLLYNFGFTSTRHGHKMRIRQYFEYGGVIPESTIKGTGAILSTRGETPLLQVIWILGALDGKQDFYCPAIKNKDDLANDDIFYDANKSPTLLAYTLNILRYCGYSEHMDETHGFILSYSAANVQKQSFSALCLEIDKAHVQSEPPEKMTNSL